jgi:hypothetical protein
MTTLRWGRGSGIQSIFLLAGPKYSRQPIRLRYGKADDDHLAHQAPVRFRLDGHRAISSELIGDGTRLLIKRCSLAYKTGQAAECGVSPGTLAFPPIPTTPLRETTGQGRLFAQPGAN